MAERDGQLRGEFEVETDVDVNESVDVGESTEPATPTSDSDTDDSMRSRVRARAGGLVSGRSLALSLVLLTAGVLVAGQLLPLGVGSDLVGLLFGAFLHGVGAAERRYVETALAGTAVGGASALLGNLVLSLVGVGLPVVVLGAVAGLGAALLGHYLGRDLRDGLTREV